MKKTTIEVSASELSDFLKYFYYMEQAAQNEGYDSSARWTVLASDFHAKLMAAEKAVGIDIRPD